MDMSKVGTDADTVELLNIFFDKVPVSFPLRSTSVVFLSFGVLYIEREESEESEEIVCFFCSDIMPMLASVTLLIFF